MSTLVYSAAAEKSIARYLDMHAQIELSGYNPQLTVYFNRFAHVVIKQIMLDNDEATGYSATLAEIKLEKEA